MQNLPLGLQSLALIRTNDCVYIDKTPWVHALTQVPGRYFLSRPRRFGKSLFVDTLKELYEGNESLFRGLYIQDRWDWNRRHPVIKIDFAGSVLNSLEQLQQRLHEILHENAERLQLKAPNHRNGAGDDAKTQRTREQVQSGSITQAFGSLIQSAREQHQSLVVVLVDEYDKPILDNMTRPGVARKMQEELKSFYSVLKEQDAHLQLVFMTGVTKFSKVSLFSGINQLKDLTLSEEYSSICGYTEHDLDHSLGAHLKGVDRQKMQQWYNGYRWTGSESVYNPYDVLLFISERHAYRNYWFETGSPTYLIRLFQKNKYFLPQLEQLEVTEEILDSFDPRHINPITLLFQSGYLTIKHRFNRLQRTMYALRIPNQEVRQALNDQFISAYTGQANERGRIQSGIHEHLINGQIEGLVASIKRMFAGVPWRNYTHNRLAQFEGYYASVLYAYFSSIDAEVIPEDITQIGQADLTIKLGDHIYIMELKVQEQPPTEHDRSALDQLRSRNYSAKYRGIAGKSIHEVGLTFSSAERNLVAAHWNSPV